MKTKRIILWLTLCLVSFYRSFLIGQECPSILPAHLHDIGETGIAYGMELRSWLYRVNQLETGTDVRHNYMYAFGAADLLIQVEIGNNLFWLGEGLLRHRRDTEDFSCRFGNKGIYFTLKQAFFEWTPGMNLFRVGRQNFAFGNGLVLNHWFDGLEFDWESGKMSGSFFGGALSTDVARACQREIVFEHLSCWKNFCSSEWGDQLVFGGTVSSVLPGRHRFSLMLMRQISSDQINLSRSAIFGSLYFRGSIPFGFSYFGEFSLQLPEEINIIMDRTWGGSIILQKMFKNILGTVQSRWGVLYGSGRDKAVFSPVFERMRWGERQHYSAHQGLIVSLQHKWDPKFLKFFKGQLDYFRRLDSNNFETLSDEMDIGGEIKFTDKYHCWLMYSFLNVAGIRPQVHKIKFEIRIILP